MNQQLLNKLDNYLDKVIDNQEIPGSIISIGIGENTIFQKFYGYQQLIPNKIKMEMDTIFDLASLTKVVSTWSSIMMLIQEKQISLDNKLGDFYSCKLDESVKNITIQNLLTHTSGLSESTFLKQYGNDKNSILLNLLMEKTKYPKETQVVYSNKGFFILGDIVEVVSGQKLEDYVTKKVWKPLGMNHTLYNPTECDNIAATEYIKEKNLVKRGIVHDENAEFIGGVSGHAGVFSNIQDLNNFCKMIVSKDSSVLQPSIIELSFKNYTIGMNENRGLAWKLNYDTIYRNYIVEHLGFTGTGIWIDPIEGMYVILLTNRVHPTRENTNIQNIRKNVKEIVFGK